MPVGTADAAARAIALTIRKGFGNQPSEAILQRDVVRLLPFVGNLAQYENTLLIANYVVHFSPNDPIGDADNPWTWYDSLAHANDPVASFVTNLDTIQRCAVAYAAKLEAKKTQYIPGSGGWPQEVLDAQAAAFARAEE